MAHSYHHGNLRDAVIDRAVEVIGAEGPASLSLRSLAADLGVSHTAPLHHFGSREGVLNAIAARGFRMLADRLIATRHSDLGFLELGVAYVDFATTSPAYFQVMFSPTMLDETDAELASARSATFAELRRGADEMAATGGAEDAASAVIAAWSIVHGLATLANSGNLDASELRGMIAGGDILDLTRRTAGMLFGSARGEGSRP